MQIIWLVGDAVVVVIGLAAIGAAIGWATGVIKFVKVDADKNDLEAHY